MLQQTLNVSVIVIRVKSVTTPDKKHAYYGIKQLLKLEGCSSTLPLPPAITDNTGSHDMSN